MANLKRLRDTENKMIVWAVDKSDAKKAYQVWTNEDGSKLYVYKKDKRVELDQTKEDVKEYGHVWKTLDDETVGYYLTSEPTNLYNRDEGDDVTYTFKDWDGTVLKTGKIEEGETPTPPADPTRAATAQYTYTFAGWNPTVGPISKKTTYTATYTATVNKYTITATSSDADLGTVSPASVANVEYGTALTVADNVITVGTGESAPTITATAGEGGEFVSWGEVPATVTGNTSVEAEFTAPEPELMTYEELAALETSTAILEELNTNDEGYYTSLTAEEHTFETTAEGATIAMIVSVKGETYETSTPLVVSDDTFVYLVSGEMEGLEPQTWSTMPYIEE